MLSKSTFLCSYVILPLKKKKKEVTVGSKDIVRNRKRLGNKFLEQRLRIVASEKLFLDKEMIFIFN